MIKSFCKKSPFTVIVILLFLFLIPGLFLLLLNNNSGKDTSLINNSTASLLLPHASLLNTGAYYRVAGQDPSLFPENNLLLLRCLFPSEEIFNCWGYDDLNKHDMRTLLAPPSLGLLSPADVEEFQREISYQGEQELDQAFSAQPKTSSGGVQDISMFGDLDLRGSYKPAGKLLINAKYPNYCFPVSWPFFFRNSFGDPRGSHRLHIGIDIFAEEGTEVYAMTDGVIQQLVNWPNAGNTLLLQGKDGRGYIYMHLQRYALGITEGKAVKKGELIAYVGHTGTISSPPHLHFQVHSDQSFSKICALNPYEALVTLCQGHGVTDLGQPKPHFSMARGPDQPLFTASSSKSKRKDYFFVYNKQGVVKTALIKTWDVKSSSPAREPGLVWHVADPAWKVPRADMKVQADKVQTPSRVTWIWPKSKPSTQLLFPADH